MQPSIFYCLLSKFNCVQLLKDNFANFRNILDLKANSHGLKDIKQLMLSLKKVALMKRLIYIDQKTNT